MVSEPRKAGSERVLMMITCKLSKEELVDRILTEYEMLNRFVRNSDKDPGFQEFEKARADYLKTLMFDVLDFTEEED